MPSATLQNEKWRLLSVKEWLSMTLFLECVGNQPSKLVIYVICICICMPFFPFLVLESRDKQRDGILHMVEISNTNSKLKLLAAL